MPEFSQKDSRVGSVLAGRYKILDCLGHGGMSIVYKADDPVLNRVVAIKLLTPDRELDEQSILRLQQEGRAASRLDHPGIVRFHTIEFADNGSPFLVMDFVEGETLAKLLEKEVQLKIDLALDIFYQTANALAHAHDKGVLHRDLKPSNIMLVNTKGNKPLVKVLDFGIAKIFEIENLGGQQLTKSGAVIGTPHYMSPEQATGQIVDHRSDIYSLGCSLYEALTGTPPNPADNALALVLKQENNQLLPLSQASMGLTFPIELEKTVRKSLANDPAQRHQSMNELSEDLKRISQEIADTSPAKKPEKQKVSSFKHFILPVVLIAALVSLILMTRMLWPLSAQRPTGKLSPTVTSASQTNTSTQASSTVDENVLKAKQVLEEGNEDQAISMYKEALDKLENSDQQSSKGYSEIANSLAKLYSNRHQVDESIAYRKRALAAERVVHGPISADVALTLREIATDYRKKSQPGEAEPYNKQALEIYEKLNGPESTEVANECMILGIAARGEGREREALSYLNRGLNIQRKSHGENSEEVAHFLAEIGFTNLGFHNPIAAEKCERQCLRIVAKLPAPVPDWANCWLALGQSLAEQGKFSGANTAAEKGLSIWRANLKIDKNREAAVTNALAVLFNIERESGNFAKALNHAKERLKLLEQAHDKDNLQIGVALMQQGECAAKTGERELAIASFFRAKRIFQTIGRQDLVKAANDQLVNLPRQSK
jgi:serine/threonine protein kinase